MGKYGTKVYLCTEFIYLQWKSACDKMLLIMPLKCILGLINHSHLPLNFYCKFVTPYPQLIDLSTKIIT